MEKSMSVFRMDSEFFFVWVCAHKKSRLHNIIYTFYYDDLVEG